MPLDLSQRRFSELERVAVVGCAGAGKSILAGELARITGLPVIYLDTEYRRQDWKSGPSDTWQARVAMLVAQPRWIMEGDLRGTFGARIGRADTIVLLDYSRWLCLFRATKRGLVYYRRTPHGMPPGYNERVRPKLLKWIWDYPRTRRPDVLARLAQAELDGKQVVILRNPKQAKLFLRDVNSEVVCWNADATNTASRPK